MLSSPPGKPELCEDLFWEWEHFWLNPVCSFAPGKIWELQLFLLMLLLVPVRDTDVLRSGDRMGRLCWPPEQAPAASWSSVIQSQPICYVLEGFGCSGDIPHVPSSELYLNFFTTFCQELSIDCRAGRDPMKLSSPFSQPVWGHVHFKNALQTSKVEVPQCLLFTGERAFFTVIHVFLPAVISPLLPCSAHTLQVG